MRIALIATAVLLALASTAHGDVTFPGQHPVRSPAIGAALAIGEKFWMDRGVQPCEHPTILAADSLRLLDEPAGDSAAERTEGCTIWLSWTVPTSQLTTFGKLQLCYVVTHALGHTAGLGHSASGVMAPEVPDSARQLRLAAPWPCRAWAPLRATRPSQRR